MPGHLPKRRKTTVWQTRRHPLRAATALVGRPRMEREAVVKEAAVKAASAAAAAVDLAKEAEMTVVVRARREAGHPWRTPRGQPAWCALRTLTTGHG